MPNYPWQIKYPNLAEMYAAGQRARINDMKIQELEQQRAMAPQIAEARRAYAAGDGTLLQSLMPDEFAKLEDRKAKIAQAELAKKQQLQAMTKMKMDMLGKVAKPLLGIKDPAKYQQAAQGLQNYLVNNVGGGKVFRPEEVDFLGDQQQVAVFAGALGGVPEPAKPPNVEINNLAAAALSRKYGDPTLLRPEVAIKRRPEEMRVLADQIAAEMQKKKVEVSKAGADRIDFSALRSELGGKEKGKQQSVLTKGRETLGMLGILKDLARDPSGDLDFQQFLSYEAKAKHWSMEKLSKVSLGAVPKSAKPWLVKMGTFKAVIDKYKAKEFHDFIGGAQTAVEIKNLADAVLNADMGSIQFEAALNALELMTKMSMEVAAQSLAPGGIPLSTSEVGYEVDRTVKDKMREARDTMATKLEKQFGTSPEGKRRVAMELFRAGLISKKQAQGLGVQVD